MSQRKGSAPLLPSPPRTEDSDPSQPPRPSRPSASRPILARPQRRQLNKFACSRCQKKKTKCDGVRPCCGACAKRNDSECKYPVREGAVSRYADLKETSECQDRENRDLKELFAYLHSRPEAEAFEVLRRLRDTRDPFIVLRCIRDADTLLAIPSLNGFPTLGREMIQLDAAALAASAIKVPARPWTSVAGDGLVSNLISAFFRWDDPFVYSFVERELFLRDMRRGQGPYCSPLLVNAICALRSMLSDKVKHAYRLAGTDLRRRFMSEAKYHLELEAGKLSLTTVQGLYLVFIVSCHEGTNKAGSMYRLAAADMLRNLTLDKAYAQWSHPTPDEADKRSALSKTCWGVFNVECFLSHFYLKAPTMPPPSIPYLHDQYDVNEPAIDIFGAPFGAGSPEPPLVPGLLSVVNQISVLQHSVMTYNASSHAVIGRDDDFQVRRGYLAKLSALENSFPPRLQYRENLTPQTIFIQVYLNAVAYNIVRPLHAGTVIHGCYTAKSILMELAALDIQLMETYTRFWGLKEYSPIVILGMCSATVTVLQWLDDPQAAVLFTRGCELIYMVQRDIVGMRYLLQGILAMAWTTGQRIPRDAVRYFEGLEVERAQLKASSFDFALPVQQEARRLLAKEDIGMDGNSGADVALLLEKWSVLQHDDGHRRETSNL
ncbi:hypothetical protein MFIFM68171_07202 [Madurella fahalii]|uniref:Zn(2)-C6 fungal-type domain-containing protein n=1 Tax=Madurella fahalii TaxID=1157608 RepID=A0ABQ0GGY0_9PEZI